jgi:hypothetical protein
LHLENECGVMVSANQMSPLKNSQLFFFPDAGGGPKGLPQCPEDI